MRVGIFVDALLHGPLSVKKYLKGILYGFKQLHLHDIELILLARKRTRKVISKLFKNITLIDLLDTTREVDILHIPDCGRPSPRINLLRKARDLGIPVIVTNHGMVHIALSPNIVYGKTLSRTFFNDMKELLRWRIAKYFLDVLIVPSNSERYLISKTIGLAPERTVVIYHGVDHKIYRPINKSKSRELLATKYGILDDFILHVSSYQPKKNVENIIAAYTLLKKKFNIKEKLVIVGNQPRERLLRLSLRLGLKTKDILFTSVVPEEDLPYFYSAAKVFVFPSLHESFGMPILEAMASDCPVVTSNVFALPEVANGAAILVNPYDVKGIAKAIHRIITDDELRERLVRKGLERAKYLTWERSAREHLNVYLKVKYA